MYVCFNPLYLHAIHVRVYIYPFYMYKLEVFASCTCNSQAARLRDVPEHTVWSCDNMCPFKLTTSVGKAFMGFYKTQLAVRSNSRDNRSDVRYMYSINGRRPKA
jgi:hypothetical protein